MICVGDACRPFAAGDVLVAAETSEGVVVPSDAAVGAIAAAVGGADTFDGVALGCTRAAAKGAACAPAA